MRRHVQVCALAAALLTSGASLSAQVDERVIYASVVDKDGSPALDLTVRDFVVREDGQAREVLRIARDTDPLQIALLVDNSAVMQARLSDLRRAISAFVSATRDGVQIALITLVERPTIVVGYTADHAALQKAIDRLFTYEAGNYLLDGIAETSQALARRPMWRSIIVAITGVGPETSYRQYTEVLRFLRDGGASLHVLSLGMRSSNAGAEIVLGRGTYETGGRYENVLAPSGLEPKARQMAAEISSQYRVTYARPDRLVPPKTTDISVRRPDLKARGMLMRTEKGQR